MKQYRLKKGVKIGALAAESDSMLGRVFVDIGNANDLIDPSNPLFLILGRTGSGKTALIRHIEDNCENASRLDPEALSMQYLHSNTMLKTIAEWGVHLDVFFKYLWRHILILELIKLRYGKEEKASIIAKIKNMLFRQSNTQEQALQYLEEHGNEYWVLADTHVKAFTNELEQKLEKDNKLMAAFASSHGGALINATRMDANSKKDTVSGEVVQQAQRIVNDYQIAALNSVLESLGGDSFKDTQRKYHVFIDDLDKNWMPDDEFYIELLKGLLYEVRELNAKLGGAKVVVAMRTNIYYRIFKKAKISEPQREKWSDVRYEIRWDDSELEELVEKRIGELFREQYTSVKPTIKDVLPIKKKRNEEEPLEYILNRTFMRPRDIIEYFNYCLEVSNYSLPLSWSTITSAEDDYSKHRWNSIIDEWKDSFDGIDLLRVIFDRHGGKFAIGDIDEEDVITILTKPECMESRWLRNMYSKYNEGTMTSHQVACGFVEALYTAGVVGIKLDSETAIKYSYEKSIYDYTFMDALKPDMRLEVHKMLWKSLRIR
jgi:hypothetical protein